jgi:hypothetical protein
MKARIWFLALASCLLLLNSCAARVESSATTPGRAGSPIETALAYNASLADSNQTLADTAVAANKSGLLSVTATGNLTSVQFTVADADRQITAILDAIAKCVGATPAVGQASCKGNAAQLGTLISRITVNVSTLDKSGELGIKDAKTQQTVDAALQTIGQMAGLVLSTLQGAGLIQ